MIGKDWNAITEEEFNAALTSIKQPALIVVPAELEEAVEKLAKEMKVEFTTHPRLSEKYRLFTFYADRETGLQDIIKLIETHDAINPKR